MNWIIATSGNSLPGIALAIGPLAIVNIIYYIIQIRSYNQD